MFLREEECFGAFDTYNSILVIFLFCWLCLHKKAFKNTFSVLQLMAENRNTLENCFSCTFFLTQQDKRKLRRFILKHEGEMEYAIKPSCSNFSVYWDLHSSLQSLLYICSLLVSFLFIHTHLYLLCSNYLHVDNKKEPS